MNFKLTAILLMIVAVAFVSMTFHLVSNIKSFLQTPTYAEQIADNEMLRPDIKWPNSFQIGISTNEPGLNITEIIYYDQVAKKIRTQIFYSILGLNPTKVLDLVMDEKNGIVAIQTDQDCRKTKFTNSLVPVQIFFSMFNTLTEYEGLDQDGLKQFKVKQFDESESAPKFYFLFDENNVFTRSRLVQQEYGQFDFDAILPLEGKTFLEEDWYTQDSCTMIDETILDESSNFASFMYQLVVSIIGNEDDILSYIGYRSDPTAGVNKYDGHFLEEEDFAE